MTIDRHSMSGSPESILKIPHRRTGDPRPGLGVPPAPPSLDSGPGATCLSAFPATPKAGDQQRLGLSVMLIRRLLISALGLVLSLFAIEAVRASQASETGLRIIECNLLTIMRLLPEKFSLCQSSASRNRMICPLRAGSWSCRQV